MAYSYRPVDRSQRFLLPPDMSEWLSEGHLVWFVIDVVAGLDTALLHEQHRRDGVGRRAYDPDMLLGLLIYSYCMGVRSSRRIEALCEVDVAYRVVCAGDVPDHTTIARFRQAHELVAQRLFVDVLAVCAEAGLAKVGVVSVDGTKVAANASGARNRNRAELESEVAEMFAQAADADEREDRLFGDDRGDGLPQELIDPGSRRARLEAALSVVKAEEAARAAEREASRAAREQAEAQGKGLGGRAFLGEEVARAEANLARVRTRAREEHAERETAAKANGRKPRAPRVHPEGCRVAAAEKHLAVVKARAARRAAEKRRARRLEPYANLTDPDSKIMKTPGGWIQGYNAQAAVNTQGVIVAAEVTQDNNDAGSCVAMMRLTEGNLEAAGVSEAIGVMLFDAGYCSEANITAAGPDRLIATIASSKLRQAARTEGYLQGEPPSGATPMEAMGHRLRTEAGATLYSLRSQTVEAVFGQTKFNRRIDRFMRRGKTAVDAEWKLIATTHNITKLFKAGITSLAVT